MNYLHKSGAQKRKEKRKRDDSARRGLQTLFQCSIKKSQYDFKKCTDANLEKGESVVNSPDQNSLYGNEIQAYNETNSEACTNIMDIDNNSEPGPGTDDRYVHSKNQASRATEIPKSSSESMKVVPVNLKKNSTDGLVGLDVGFLTAEIPSQSDIENYVTRGHINFRLTLPKDGNNQTFPEGRLKFKNINAEQHTRDWLVWSLEKLLYCFPCRLFSNSVCCRLSASKSS